MKLLILSSAVLTLFLSLVATVCYGFVKKRNSIIRAASSFMYAALLANFTVLLGRCLLIGRLPLSDGGDFLLLFSFLILLFYAAFERFGHVYTAGTYVMGVCAALCAFVLLVLRDKLTISSPLSPSLKSPLLTVHVLTAALSYAGFAFSAGLAAARLRKLNCDPDHIWTYRIIILSFCMLTITIVLGAFWAEMAWGAYWSWDPKETWALITWILYAIYLHRYQHWNDQKADAMLVIGFILVLFTFFGTNYLLSGLHSYA